MKIIDQSYTIENQPDDLKEVPKFIEKIARTCYKSESKITETSAEAFCKNLIKRGHEAMLEHASITIRIPNFIIDDYFDIYNDFDRSIQKYIIHSYYEGSQYLTANVRTWRRVAKENDPLSPTAYYMLNSISDSFTFDIIRHPVSVSMYEVVSRSEILKMSKDFQAEHLFYTVRFITDRGVSHELVRHRDASFAQESTRYVKYNNIEFIRPVFDWGTGEKIKTTASIIGGRDYNYERYKEWQNSIMDSEYTYKKMIEQGCSPQEARTVLPNSLKTEIVVSANVYEWLHIFELRCAKSAHPQIRELMMLLEKEI